MTFNIDKISYIMSLLLALNGYLFCACVSSSGVYFLPMNLLASYIVFLGLCSAWATALYPTTNPSSLKKNNFLEL